jgi:hypothetical protein
MSGLPIFIVFEMNDEELASHIASFQAEITDAEWVMIFLGWLGVDTITRAHAKTVEEVSESLVQCMQSMHQTAESHTDEIVRRRAMWHFLGGSVASFAAACQEKPGATQALVGLWQQMTTAGHCARSLLEHNVVWRDAEKEVLLDKYLSAESMIAYMAPRIVKQHDSFRAFAKSSGLRL